MSHSPAISSFTARSMRKGRGPVTETGQTGFGDTASDEAVEQADSPLGDRVCPGPDGMNGPAGFRGPWTHHGIGVPAPDRSHEPAAVHYENRGGVMAKYHSRPSAQYRYEHYDPR
jgi:hypothetical protein